MGAVSFSLDPELLRCLKQVLPLSILVETGTFEGETVHAALPFFEMIHTVELSEKYFALAQERFRPYPHVHMWSGLSGHVLRQLRPELKDRSVLYWLDAHWCSADNTGGFQSQCPLLDELEAIETLNDQSVVLIDDARYFMSPPPEPHDVNQWPTLQRIIETMKAVSLTHEFMIVSDVVIFFPSRMRSDLVRFARKYARAPWIAQQEYDLLRERTDAVEARNEVLDKACQDRLVSINDLNALLTVYQGQIQAYQSTLPRQLRCAAGRVLRSIQPRASA